MGLKEQKEQEELFNQILSVKHDIQHLASYVQNNFERLLEDEEHRFTKHDIKDNIPYMEHDCDKIIEHIKELKIQMKKLMESYLG